MNNRQKVAGKGYNFGRKILERIKLYINILFFKEERFL